MSWKGESLRIPREGNSGGGVGLVEALLGIVISIAAFLAVKVWDHGEKIGILEAKIGFIAETVKDIKEKVSRP